MTWGSTHWGSIYLTQLEVTKYTEQRLQNIENDVISRRLTGLVSGGVMRSGPRVRSPKKYPSRCLNRTFGHTWERGPVGEPLFSTNRQTAYADQSGKPEATVLDASLRGRVNPASLQNLVPVNNAFQKTAATRTHVLSIFGVQSFRSDPAVSLLVSCMGHKWIDRIQLPLVGSNSSSVPLQQQ